jgi:hypothetical protein
VAHGEEAWYTVKLVWLRDVADGATADTELDGRGTQQLQAVAQLHTLARDILRTEERGGECGGGALGSTERTALDADAEARRQ